MIGACLPHTVSARSTVVLAASCMPPPSTIYLRWHAANVAIHQASDLSPVRYSASVREHAHEGGALVPQRDGRGRGRGDSIDSPLDVAIETACATHCGGMSLRRGI